MWGEPLPERVGAVWGSGFWNFWIDGLWTTKWNVLWHALQCLHAEIQDWRPINRFDVLQHFSNDIMFFGGVNTYTNFHKTTSRYICQCFTISSPSKLSSSAWFFEGSAPLDWRSLGFDYVPTKSHIRWGDPIGENGWFYPRKLHIRDSCPGSDSVQGWLLDGDTVWNLFVFVTLFSFNATVIVTHCKRLEHLHGVRLERSPHYQGFVALACADGGFLDLFEWAKRKMFQTCSGLTLQHIFMYGLSTSFGFPSLERCETGYVLGFCYRNSVRTVRTVVFGGRKLGVFHHRICL